MVLKTPEEQLAQAENIVALTKAFESVVNDSNDPNNRILENVAIQEARDAMGQIALLLKVEAFGQLQQEGHVAAAQAVEQTIDNMPPDWKSEFSNKLHLLLKKVEAGLKVAEDAKLYGYQPPDAQPFDPNNRQTEGSKIQAPANAAPQPNQVNVQQQQVVADVQKMQQQNRQERKTEKINQKTADEISKAMKAMGAAGNDFTSVLKTGQKIQPEEAAAKLQNALTNVAMQNAAVKPVKPQRQV